METLDVQRERRGPVLSFLNDQSPVGHNKLFSSSGGKRGGKGIKERKIVKKNMGGRHIRVILSTTGRGKKEIGKMEKIIFASVCPSKP